MLGFHAAASPGAIFRIACDASDQAALGALFGAVRGSGFLDRFPDASLLPCIVREVTDSDQLQIEIAEMPDPRLRITLEAIAASPRGPHFGTSARAALAILDAEGPSGIAATARRLATEDDLFFHFLRSYVRYTPDPRPVVPALLDVLERGDVSGYVQGSARQALFEMTGQRFRGAAEARRFWVANRNRTVDEWLVAATGDVSAEVRRDAYEALGGRPPSATGRQRLLLGLEEEDVELRYIAAVSLARWGDRRAAPVLVAFLPRWGAFVSLGRLHGRTLGFDWHASIPARRAAIARWREWAQRLEASSSEP